MHLIDTLEARIAQLDAQHLRRRLRPTQSPCGPHVRLNGTERLAFCSNDYLGLANHPAVVEALAQGARLHGAGSGASHLISGHSQAHEALEHKLAAFVGPQFGSNDSGSSGCRTLFFGSGYMANLAVTPALAATGEPTAIFSEALNHASLIDAVRLARGARVHVYPHGDLQTLENQLAQEPATNKLIVTDSVFSMDGDIAPLPQLLALAERYGAWLIVDDAHGFGVLGAGGQGVLAHFGLHTPHISPHIVYMGTLGKAAGVGGAFVAACPQVIDWLVQKSRSYIFSTAAPPAMAHALCASLDVIAGPEGHARRQHLQTLIAHLRTRMADSRWHLLPSDTPIQPLILGSNETALAVSAQLETQGLWVPAIRPPTVPAGTARLRIALSAAHSLEDVDRLVNTLKAME